MKCPKCKANNPDKKTYCSECGAKLTPQEEIFSSRAATLQAPKEELSIGSTFAERYQVIEELGKGGMGRVYKVVDTKIKEKIALKLLNPKVAADESTIERFRNELKFARKISHRNVCRMYDFSEEKGTPYITMEYVSGEDLKSTIRRVGQLSAGKAIFIARQVCEGLTEAHRLGVVHRDLKPRNIMIDKEGNARIMDFGIARSIKTKGITDEGVIVGTPEYMSPEQVEGKKVDHRSDIYSLGIILYEMLTGRVPFDGDTPISIAVKQKTEPAPDPRKINANIPEDLSHLILKCMEKNNENRYQSAEELLADLSKIEKGIPATEKVLPKRRTTTSKEITVTFSLKKLFIPALVFIAIIIIGIILWRFLPRKEAVSIKTGKPSIAVMYFKNNTGDKSLDHWSSALSDLLIADLSQSKYLRVLSGERLFNILRKMDLLEQKTYSSEELKEVAAQGRIDRILLGNYLKAGDTFRINVVLQDAATGELIGSEMVEGVGEENIFHMVDELTRRIKAKFKLSTEQMASDIDKDVSKITTSSPEAYKYYSEGRRYHEQGIFRKSIQLMEKAVAIDPEFAMAYRSMAVSYGNMGYSAEKKKYLQYALKLTDRVSDRERYTIQGDFYATSEKTYDKSIEAYEKLLQLYPDDLTGNNNLGMLYLYIEEWDKAIERCEVCIQNKDKSYFGYNNQAQAYAAKGLYDKAEEVLQYYLNNVSDDNNIRRYLAVNFLIQGKYDLALAEMDKAISLDPTRNINFAQKGEIYQLKGDFITAEQEYQKLLQGKEQIAQLFGRGCLIDLYLLQGRFMKAESQAKQGIELAEKMGDKFWKSLFQQTLANIYLNSGKLEQALQECNKGFDNAMEAEDQSSKRWALNLRGYIYLEMKSMDQALKTAEELRQLVEEGMSKKEIRLYYDLMGMLELKRKNFSKAIEYFKKAITLLPFQSSLVFDYHAAFINSLALAYNQAGDLEKARVEYERIISLTTGRIHQGDIYAKSYYMLGKIYQQKGWEEKAVENYEKFLTLWKDADPGISELADAKKQLAALRNH
jgi:serine/threonine protein kinase/Tfp pilus assembly protein PilF